MRLFAPEPITPSAIATSPRRTESSKKSSLPSHPPGRQVELDGLRGLAALMVCLSHLKGALPSDTSVRLFGSLVNSLSHRFLCGAAAVDFFFVLSGYVLALPFLGNVANDRKLNYQEFLLRRAFRIYPAHFAALIIAFVLCAVSADVLHHTHTLSDWARSAWTGDMTALEGLRHLLLVSGLNLNVLNGPLWSLATEVQVSLVLPLIFLLLQSDRSPGTAMGLFLSLTGLAFGIGATGSGLLFLPIFMMGTLLAAYRQAVMKLISRYSKYWAVILAAAMLMFWNRAFQAKWIFPNMTADYVSSMGSVVIIGVVVSCPSHFQWLGRHIIAWLGFVSYSLYLVHLPIILACAAWASRLQMPVLLGLTVGMALSFVVSHLMAVFVEKWGVGAGKTACDRLSKGWASSRLASSGIEAQSSSAGSSC